VIKDDPDCFGYIENRTCFDEAILLRTSVLEHMMNKKNQDESYRRFVSNTLDLLAIIKKCLDEE
jgi:hypothetical protein